MIRTFLVFFFLIHITGRADEPIKTSSRVNEAIERLDEAKKAELKTEIEEIYRVTKAADVHFVPAVRNSESFEVFSLVPSVNDEKHKDKPRLHDFPILGRVLISNPEQLRKLRDSLITGICPPIDTLICGFKPRHAIRMTSKTGTVDVLICFECGQSAHFGLPEQTPPFRGTFMRSITLDLLNSILDAENISRDVPKEHK